MLEGPGFLVAVLLAHAATNIDNLALMLALGPASGPRRVALGYVAAQALVIAAAVAVGAGAEALPASALGWFGLLPIALGVRALLARGGEAAGPRGRLAFGALVATFLGLSADSFAIVAGLLADSAATFDPWALGGAAASVAAFAAAGMLAGAAGGAFGRVAARLDRFAPFVMIAAGLYMLADTLTDAL
jgi:cadmium resistance protein CadD (predicted permease)